MDANERVVRQKIDPKLQMLLDGEPGIHAERIERNRARVVRSERYVQRGPGGLATGAPARSTKKKKAGPKRKASDRRSAKKAASGEAAPKPPRKRARRARRRREPPAPSFRDAATGVPQLPDQAIAALDRSVPTPEVAAAEPGATQKNIDVNVFVRLREGQGGPQPEHRTAASSRLFAQAFARPTPSRRRKADQIQVTAWQGRLASARVPLSRLAELGLYADVDYVEIADQLRYPRPVYGDVDDDADKPARERLSDPALHPQFYESGPQVVIGIIDVGGFDFAHGDFLDDEGSTRWHSIWDQGGSLHAPPTEFDYGSVITQQMMNDAIQQERADAQSPVAWMLEPQSQQSLGSHGTHVASIAGGRHGVCPASHLVGVLVSPEPEIFTDRRLSFYDSTRIAHAVDYILSVADELGLPASLNISLGTNGHAHDASSAISRWIDNALATPGRSVCVAAGNAGQETSEAEGDYGWIMGRIHTSGQIAASGLTQDVEWVVVGNGIADTSENELELWYSPQDRLEIRVRPPGMPWTEWIEPGQFVENRPLPDGTRLSVYNALYQRSNGDNKISLYLSPDLATPGHGVLPGLWTVRLRGQDVRDGRFHGWVERDDPAPRGPEGPQQEWDFPSFFSSASNVDSHSVSSLACGHRVISVANLDGERGRINASSSQGPTRDGRQKPDVAAPGTEIPAAKAFAGSEGHESWTLMSGTSMASPFVAGVIGLMLIAEDSLTAAQILGIIKRTAAPLPGDDYSWLNTSGFGAIDLDRCVFEAQHVNDMVEL